MRSLLTKPRLCDCSHAENVHGSDEFIFSRVYSNQRVQTIVSTGGQRQEFIDFTDEAKRGHKGRQQF